MGFIGSLARISNSREQGELNYSFRILSLSSLYLVTQTYPPPAEFVSGLFAAEAPSQPSMAWIGLRQGSDKNWNDGSEVTFVRRGLDFLMPVAHDINEEEEDNALVRLLYYKRFLKCLS